MQMCHPRETAPRNLVQIEEVGFVTSVRGASVTADLPPGAKRPSLGRFVKIQTQSSILVGSIAGLSLRNPDGISPQGCWATAELDLIGEIATQDDGTRRFRRGTAEYPTIGDAIGSLESSELEIIHARDRRQTIEIGRLHQDQSIPATIRVNELLNKHFAVVGTTGVGKSSGVTVLLSGVMEARQDLRIFLLDNHNEYGRCFGERANVISPRTLKLPFWLFNFEEFVDVIFGGRPAAPEEVEILAELIPIARSNYGAYKAQDRASIRRNDPKTTGFTCDTPVPYLLQDLIGLIDERMGRLDNRSSRMIYHRLMTRIETMRNDPRYAFMFQNANVGGDTMADLLIQLFRLEPDGKPMTVMQLAGLPDEVKDAVVCVLCRLAFDFGLWSEGAIPLLVVCEEAHRFASADQSVGFHPTRRALARIAKEGRKYGVHLGLVTQRPAELDPTIISQCSTLFAMRMANDRDQALLRSAVSDSAADLLSFIPSLGTREVIAFGEGVTLPARMIFKALPPDRLPQGDTFGAANPSGVLHEREFVRSIIERWRGATLTCRARAEDHEPEPPTPIGFEAKGGASDPTSRSRLLHRFAETAPLSDAAGPIRFQR